MRVGLLSTTEAPYLGHTIEALSRQGIAVDCVIYDPLNPTDREREIEKRRIEGKLPPIAMSEIENLAIPCFHVRSHLSKGCLALIEGRGLDLLVNAGAPRILNDPILSAPRVGIVSCHPGLLPEYRGSSCVEWALFLEGPVGNTVFFMDEGIDTGPVILAEEVPVSPSDTYSDIRVAVYRAGFDLLARALRKVIDEDLSPDRLAPQGEGRYFKPIPDVKLEAVIAKMNARERSVPS